MNAVSLAAVSFGLATALALLCTPLVARWALRRNICDHPSTRRVHTRCVPRAGGIALCLAFVSTYTLFLGRGDGEFSVSLTGRDQISFLLGALAIFALGLWDDVRSLPATVKFAGQVLVGLLVYYGGIEVELLSVTLYRGVSLPAWLSLGITVGWVVLLINAINLIDGLDGLAAGVCLFVALTLLVLSVPVGHPMLVVGFSALAGCCLGFLRYNFNPATVFMGDSGSYLLGYLLAALTIKGAMKSHATVALLIPVIALGVPLLDTLLAPVRRFLLGKRIFDPDKSHIHHLLLQMGYSQRRVVLIIYALTVVLGLTALAFVFVKDQLAAYVLVLPGGLLFLVVKKLGYLEYLAADKIWGWLRDLTDEAGLSSERRSFLNLQMQIMASASVAELWEGTVAAVRKLDFDLAELALEQACFDRLGEDERHRRWVRDPARQERGLHDTAQFRLEMPLMDDSGRRYGVLWLVKDLHRSSMTHYTLRRVEHLRRTVIGVLARLAGDA